MAEPEIALVFSAEAWVEQLHRHCSDHGGARVRQLLVDPDLALDEEYSTLVTGHRWPALTPALVDDLHHRGRSVLGVWDRAEPESRVLLAAAGVDGLVASDASTSEIVDAIAALPRPSDTPRIDTDDVPPASRARRIVVGGPAGAGSTEIAIALAAALGARRSRALLVDLDDAAPAVATRLGLALEPNLRTALDAVEFHVGCAQDAIVPAPGVDVVAGVATRTRLRIGEVLRALDALGRDRGDLVVDTAAPRDPAGDLAVAVAGTADVLVAVCSPSPVGIARFVGWLADVLPAVSGAAVHVVVDRAPASAFRRGEIRDELAATVAAASITFVPTDARLDDAAWSGAVATRGPFARAVRDLALVIGPS
jgi:MinD-like ATPase involved in chromosome partitioning or flagellar assembly